jgi:hypothetical protein
MPYTTEMAKGRAVRPESKNMAQKQSGFPGNLGDPVVSTGIISAPEWPKQKHSRLAAVASWAAGAKPRGTAWYRQAKATKCGGTAGRKS